ncbi:MAG: hypothetical protein KatS3mg060_1168 [Dehalococcoidia bacterium]|nr:MAG: hypothetical protein KatS3mg060_1168 [Dehalococcoidia bacterium]
MADQYLRVRATHPEEGTGTDLVTLHERHPAHPNEEAYVAGDAVVLVAHTPLVAALIAAGRLEVVEEPAQPRPPRRAGRADGAEEPA